VTLTFKLKLYALKAIQHASVCTKGHLTETLLSGI